jgi:glycine betaine/proline transport system permease protein
MATTVPAESNTEVPGIDGSTPAVDRLTVATGLPSRILGTPLSRVRLTSLHKLVLGLGGVGLVTLVSVLAWGSSMEFPNDVGRDIGLKIDDAVTWMTKEGDWLFDGIKEIILKVLLNLRDALLWFPWPAMITAIGLLAWRLAGWRVSLFSVAAMLAIGFVGLWSSAMETLALVTTSVVLAVAIGVPLGVLGARNALADAVMRPVLDLMQTMPSFVYLVPAIMFFSLGNVPAVMATIIYAVPPAIRLTSLGIRQVSPETIEAARSFGATPTQLLLKVQMPMALPTIMAGINQTTMMALAMVVVGALVGAGGLGEDVLRALGRLEPGKALLAGMGIVFMAIIIDRLTQALVKGQPQAPA